MRGVQLNDGTTWSFPLMGEDQGRAFSLDTRDWVPRGDARMWKIPLFPFTGGMAASKIRQPDGRGYYASVNNADCSHHGAVVGPPKLNSLTLTSAVITGWKAIPVKDSAGSHILIISGRYVHKMNSSHTISTDKDFGASAPNHAGDIVQYAGAVYVALWNSATAPGGATSWLQMRDSSGTWTASADTRATAFCVSKDRLWRVDASATAGTVVNNIYSIYTTTAANVKTNANWSNETNPYHVGDTSYQCTQLFDYGGIVCGVRPDGVFFPDPETKFINHCPQLFTQPDVNAGLGCWLAEGWLFVPSQHGLFMVRPNASFQVGPEMADVAGGAFRTRAGTYYQGVHYILVEDQANSTMVIMKMTPDDEGVTGRRYGFIFDPWVLNSSSLPGRWLLTYMGATNPEIVFGGGSAATRASYFRLGRGGRDIDDPNYQYESSSRLTTGEFTPLLPGEHGLARLIGIEVYAYMPSSSYSLSATYTKDPALLSDSGVGANLLTTQEGGGSATMTGSGAAERFTRYASPSDAAGSRFNIQVSIANQSSAAGTTRAEIREMYAFGVYVARKTDIITFRIPTSRDGLAGGFGSHNGLGPAQTEQKFRKWANAGTVLTGEVDGYEDAGSSQGARTKRFVILDVKSVDAFVQPSGDRHPQATKVIEVSMARVDYAGAYASD